MARKVFISSDMSVDEALAEAAEQAPLAALIWPWLITYFDDWGRALANPRRIKMHVFPGNPLITHETIAEALPILEQVGLIRLYEADNTPCMSIADPDTWRKYQTHIRWDRKTTQSLLPPPPDPPVPSSNKDSGSAPGYSPATAWPYPGNSTPSPSPSPSTAAAPVTRGQATATKPQPPEHELKAIAREWAKARGERIPGALARRIYRDDRPDLEREWHHRQAQAPIDACHHCDTDGYQLIPGTRQRDTNLDGWIRCNHQEQPDTH